LYDARSQGTSFTLYTTWIGSLMIYKFFYFTEGSIVKATFTSHVGWVSTVCWSTTHERLFVSGGHDNILKLWDSRRQVFDN
jgi:WD40 repeat protein